MLILPLHRKVGWNNLPILTLLLIAANTLIFLFTQLDDDQEFNLALSNYRDSGLYEIERAGYLDYLDERNDLDYLTGQHETGDARRDLITQMIGIQTDREFLQRLHDGRVVEPSDEHYRDWQQKRARFESLYESITYVGFGLRAGKPELIPSSVTCFCMQASAI
jgi:hypothetical protein